MRIIKLYHIKKHSIFVKKSIISKNIYQNNKDTKNHTTLELNIVFN